MTKPESTLQNRAVPRKGRKYFSLAEARRALPLVKRITADIQSTRGSRVRLHAELSAQAIADGGSANVSRLQNELDQQSKRLEGLVGELQKIGVDLKDPSRGLLDFPAVHEGREVLLCWKSGEETITHWHEVDTGFAGRRPVEELQEQP